MKIEFNLPHAFDPGCTERANAYTLRALLDCMVNINVQYLREHPKTPGLYQSGVRYGRTIIWEPIPALYKPNKHILWGKYWAPTDSMLPGKRIGDCKSLATARMAELIVSGRKVQPRFRFDPQPDGHWNFHILLDTDKGYEEDPSRVLGMR